MHENVKRELKILLFVIGPLLVVGVVMYLVPMLTQTLTPMLTTPSPQISPLNQTLLKFPSIQSIQTVSLVEGGCDNGVLSSKNPSTAADQTLKWLNDAEPISVKLPKLHENVVSACGLPYNSLYLRTNNGEVFDIFPANYIWRGRSLSGNPNYEIRYVENVIEVDVNHRVYFLKSKSLYDWLKSDGWTNEFG